MKFINHSNPLRKHWNWASNINFKNIHNFNLEITKHGFTHVDAPSHMIRGGKSLDKCNLDLLCGWAKIVDVSECIGDKPITHNILEEKLKDVDEGDIIVLRSNLNKLFPNTSKRYWENSPYLEDSGSKFLISKKIKSIVFDFPQDRAAKDLQFRVVKNHEFTEHQIVLGANVMHVEHVINLDLIKNNNFFLFSLPIKLPKADGGNCTPISIHGIKNKKYEIIDHSKSMLNNEHFKSYLTLDFNKGDQVQETGFCLTGLTHTLFTSSNINSFKDIFNKLVIDKYDIINRISDLDKINEKTVFINNQNIDHYYLCEKLKNIKIDILCLASQPSSKEITEIHRYVSKVFINLENLNNLKKDSLIIFGVLNFEKSLISPSRIVSIS